MRLATINLDPERRCYQCAEKIKVQDVYIETEREQFCSHSCADEWLRDNQDAYDAAQEHPRHGGAFDNTQDRAAWLRLK
jgi:hypothetical protein